ncbi:hypothetical protein NXW00_17745 [Bacteroides thetaiotaomicron]|nr:hypothetical protein [Bacteroides thetaiotaomicron]
MIRIYADSKAEPVRCTNRRPGNLAYYVGLPGNRDSRRSAA